MALGTRMWSAGRWLVLAAALCSTFALFFLLSFRIAIRSRDVKVPDVRGKLVAEAGRALGAVGLTMTVDARRPDSTVADDRVISQSSDPGSTLRRQRTVHVIVSEGIQNPIVPAVTGQPERAATLQLSDSHVQVAFVDEVRSSGYPPDAVIAQDPPARMRRDRVALLVNRGQSDQTFVMPDVIGANGGGAVDALRRRGFRVNIAATVAYPGIPPGTVVRQTPQAGYQVSLGDLIALEVSK